VGLVSKAVAAALVLGLVLVLPMFALYSANSFSKAAWDGIGRSRKRWTLAFFVLPLLVGPAAAVFYFARIRRDLLPFGRIRRITDETQATIVRGPDEGRVGVASPGKGLHRLIFALTSYAWFRFDTGERVAVAQELLEPISGP
jgi:hypothetical protein